MKKSYSVFTTDDRGLIRRATGYTWDTVEGAQNFADNIPGAQNFFVAEVDEFSWILDLPAEMAPQLADYYRSLTTDVKKLRRQVRDALNKTKSASKIKACAKILEV